MGKVLNIFFLLAFFLPSSVLAQANSPFLFQNNQQKSGVGIGEVRQVGSPSSFSEEATSTSKGEWRERWQEKVRERQESLLNFLQERRQEREEERLKRRQEFQSRLQKIVSQRRRVLLEKINEKITEVNQGFMTKMAEALDRLQEILDKIANQKEEAEAKSLDVDALEEAITVAEGAIMEAREAVAQQAEKEYVLDISDEERLRALVGGSVSQFRLDLRDVHKKVVDAKQAVYKAASELAKLRGQIKKEE